MLEISWWMCFFGFHPGCESKPPPYPRGPLPGVGSQASSWDGSLLSQKQGLSFHLYCNKLLLILIKLKNLFVNENPGVPPTSADLLHFLHTVDIMIHAWAPLRSGADLPGRINGNHKKSHSQGPPRSPLWSWLGGRKVSQWGSQRGQNSSRQPGERAGEPAITSPMMAWSPGPMALLSSM